MCILPIKMPVHNLILRDSVFVGEDKSSYSPDNGGVA